MNEHERLASRIRMAARAGLLFLCTLVATAAQAFPALNLTPEAPNIESSFITVDYIGNNAGGVLTASGFANRLTPPGSPLGNIAGGFVRHSCEHQLQRADGVRFR